MRGGRTDRVLTAFRIGDPDGAHPIYDSEGARLYPGRWNTPASPVIYTSAYYSTAMLVSRDRLASELRQHNLCK